MRSWTVAAALALLFAGGAAAQPAYPSPAAADLVAARIEVRASSLARASELTPESMRLLALEVRAGVDDLADAAAPYPTLAAQLPEIRETTSQLVQQAMLASEGDVEDLAEELLEELQTFRLQARNLAPAYSG